MKSVIYQYVRDMVVFGGSLKRLENYLPAIRVHAAQARLQSVRRFDKLKDPIAFINEGRRKDGGWPSALFDAQWRGMKESEPERPPQTPVSSKSCGCYICSREGDVEEWERAQGRCNCAAPLFPTEDTELAAPSPASSTSACSRGWSRGWARAVPRLICLPGSWGQPCYACSEPCARAGGGHRGASSQNETKWVSDSMKMGCSKQ